MKGQEAKNRTGVRVRWPGFFGHAKTGVRVHFLADGSVAAFFRKWDGMSPQKEPSGACTATLLSSQPKRGSVLFTKVLDLTG